MKSNFLVSTTTLLSLSLYPLQFVYAAGNYTFNSIVISRTTITTISGLSTAILSNPEWTGNTAITSTIVETGSPVTTTLPVLYGCSLCAGDGHGLVFWGLAAESGRSIAIYELTGLPTFTIGLSGQPVPVITSTPLVPSSTAYGASSVVSTTGSATSPPMATSTLPSVAASYDLPAMSSVTTSSSSLSSSSSHTTPSRPAISTSVQGKSPILPNESRYQPTLRSTTSLTRSSGSPHSSVRTEEQTAHASKVDAWAATASSALVFSYKNITTQSVSTSDPASIALEAELAYLPSTNFVAVTKTTQCDPTITGLGGGYCKPKSSVNAGPSVANVIHFLNQVSDLDSAIPRASAPAGGTSGSATQTFVNTASPAFPDLFPVIPHLNIQHTTTEPEMTQWTQTQNQQAQKQNLPAQLPSTQVDPGVSTSVGWLQAVAVQSQTIVQGAPAVLVSGATVKYSAGSIYVGNNAAPISAAPQPEPPRQKGPDATVIGGLSFTPMQQDVTRATNPPAVVVSGQMLRNNGPAATINGQLVAYSSGSIHVGTSVAAAPTAASQQQQDISLSTAIIGGLTVVPVPQGSHAATDKPEVIVQGQTLKEDSSAITIDGNLVAYSSGSVHVGTNAAPAPTFTSQHNPENPPPQVLEDFTHTPLLLPGSPPSATLVAVGGQTVSFGSYGARIGTNSILPGAAPITISGTPVSLGSGGLVIGSQTYATSGWSTKYETGSNLATVAGQAIYVAPTGAIMLGSATLTLGGSPITISGTPISLGVAGLVVGSSTVPLPSTSIQSIFSIGGTTFTANPTGFSVAGTFISKGGPAVTIAGTPVSLGSSVLIIGSSTVPLATPSFQSVFTVGGGTFTANPTAFPIAGTTLSANGPAITISGTPISLGPSSLVIGTSTFALNGPAATTTAGLGGLILQGLGPVASSPTSTSTPTSELFAGSAVPMTRAPGWALSVWGIKAACMLFAALAL